MFKKVIIACAVACVSLLSVACGNDIKSACEHTNDICGSTQGFQKIDCNKAEEEYDKKSDADKEKSDKAAECILDKDKCEDIVSCASN